MSLLFSMLSRSVSDSGSQRVLREHFSVSSAFPTSPKGCGTQIKFKFIGKKKTDHLSAEPHSLYCVSHKNIQTHREWGGPSKIMRGPDLQTSPPSISALKID